MRIGVVGVGKLGGIIAYTLLLLQQKNEVTLMELKTENKEKARAEYLDLLPVAHATKNKLELKYSLNYACDAYIITAGIPRRNAKQPKKELFRENYEIVKKIVCLLPKRARVFVATNPPNEITKKLKQFKYRVHPLRNCTDYLRRKAGPAKKINSFVLNVKGFTQYTPGYACTKKFMCKAR